MLRRAHLVGAFIVAAAVCAACHSELQEDAPGHAAAVAIQGSNTMTKLMQRMAEAYMQQHPETKVTVTSDDSGTGIAALIDKKTDVAMASRDLDESELKTSGSSGVHLRKITIAGDAIVVLVNNKNQIADLNLQQLKDIFTGKVKNWKAVGGADKPIEVYLREPGSGTFNYFLRYVLKGEKYLSPATSASSANEIATAVEKHENAIAYEGLANANLAKGKVKVVPLKVADYGKAVAPTVASELSDYPLSRPLIIFVDHKPRQSVRQFVEFCTGDGGRKVITQEGYSILY